VDTSTTQKAIEGFNVDHITLAALSGICTRNDVLSFPPQVKAVLVGEALMRASSPINKIKELAGEMITYVKICGLMDKDTACATAEAGADFIGIVFAESRRKVTTEQAKEIVDALHKWRKVGQIKPFSFDNVHDKKEWYTSCRGKLVSCMEQVRPLIVGVFADNDPDYINNIADNVGIDIVQLSGHEGFEIIQKINRPTIKAVHVGNESTDIILQQIKAYAVGVLLDTSDPTAKGGTGKSFDWTVARSLSEQLPIMLAGGLNPENVASAVNKVSPFAVDVSSGVETEGKKDIHKIEQFIKQAKGLC